MTELSTQEIIETFINTRMEGNYDFLQDDLVKLANAFVNAAKVKIQREERAQCVKIARSLNHLVAEKILEVRNRS